MKEKKNVVWINRELSDERGHIFTEDGHVKSEEKTDNVRTIDVAEDIDTMFSKHMSQYIGQTVTIYTTSGSSAGLGQTGVLLECNSRYIKLLTHIGSAPKMPNKKACRQCRYYKSCLEAFNKYQSVGSIAEIPLCSLVVFIHNSL